MPEWEIRVKGDSRALSELAGELDNELATIEKREDKYFMKSEKFEGETEFEEVNDIGEELLDTLSGIASIHLRTEIDPELYTHHVVKIENGERSTHAFVRAEKTEMRLFTGKPDLDTWVELSQKDSKVEDLLTLVNKGLDWRNLYAVYEFIKEDIEENIHDKWNISKSKIDRFKATANSRKILGDEARHGDQRAHHKEPMSHGKAKSLIERICKKWLDSKIDKDTSGYQSLTENYE